MFDADWYLHEYPEAREYAAGPWNHYVRIGRAHGLKPNEIMDPGWYRERYPDVALSGIDPLDHYYHWGAAEGRDPGPAFSPAEYLAMQLLATPYSAVGGMNPLLHYLRYGRLSRERTQEDGEGVAEGSAVSHVETLDLPSVAPAQSHVDAGTVPVLSEALVLGVSRSTHTEPGTERSHLLAAIRGLSADLPGSARIVVATARDDEMIRATAGRGTYLGRHRDGGVDDDGRRISETAAMALIEGARWEGRDYLLIPRDVSSIPVQDARLHAYLLRQCSPIDCDPNAGTLWALQEPSPLRPLDRLVAALQSKLERPVTLLNWDTGMDLEAAFPECLVHRAHPGLDDLPYLDGTFDIVAMPSDDFHAREEARRVGAQAVVQAQRDRSSILWKPDGMGPRGTVSIVVLSPPMAAAALGFMGRLSESVPDSIDAEFIICRRGDGSVPAAWRGAVSGRDFRAVRPARTRAADLSKALRVATGDSIAVVDGSTAPLPGWLDYAIGTLARESDAVAVSGMLLAGDGRVVMCGAEWSVAGSLVPVGAGSDETDGSPCRIARRVAAVPVNFTVVRGTFAHTIGDPRIEDGLMAFADCRYDPDVVAIRPWDLQSDD